MREEQCGYLVVEDGEEEERGEAGGGERVENTEEEDELEVLRDLLQSGA